MSNETITAPSEAGSVSYVVSHLLAWIARRRPGIVWVEFGSDEIRDQAMSQVDSMCRDAGISSQRIAAEAVYSRQDWERVRGRLESLHGVVHLLFPALFNRDSLEADTFRGFATALNLDRERIFSANAAQIWWVSRPLSAILRPFAPDFLSWVHTRLTLSELAPFIARNGPGLEIMADLEKAIETSSAIFEADTQESFADPRLLEPTQWLRQATDLFSIGKAKEALFLAGESAYGFRQELSIGQSAQRGLASALYLLALIESHLGRRQQALASIAEAVRHYGALAETNPKAVLPNLAAALNNQANLQRDMGQRSEALASIGQALDYYRALAETNPSVFSPKLAVALNNLATLQSAMGQRADALASIGEAVRLRRKLAESNPDASFPSLAAALNNLATLQSAMGQRAEALASIGEAVRLRRSLAEVNPAAFLPDLAGSLNNQANLQSEMGQRGEALVSIGEAVRHYRALAEANPDAFLPDLAMSLNNQAKFQSEMGQRGEALISIGDALRLRRALAEANPDAFLPDLAMSLNNQATLLSAMEQRAEALASIGEALRLYRPLTEANPDAFLPDLAMSLNNQATLQSATGQWGEALASSREAVSHYRRLANMNSDAFLPDLARALSVYADSLAAVKHVSEARDSAREALLLLAPSFSKYPGVFGDLTKLTIEKYLFWSQSLSEKPDEQVLSAYASLLDTRIGGTLPYQL